MGRTFIRQVSQIQGSDTYTDNLAAGATLESSAADLEADLNGLRSQVNRIIGETNWYDDISTVNTKQRDLKDLNTDLDDLEEKRLICGTQVLANVTVPASQNYVVLGTGQLPTVSAAVNTGTALGAVVATLPGDVGTPALQEVAGPNALSPKNLVVIRDATTKDVITSSNGFEIFGLLQAENGVADGDTFNITDKQVQIQFVENSSDDLVAVAAADIENRVIEYLYPQRVSLDTLTDDCTWPPHFTDQTTTVDVTLDNAIDAQGATAATQATDINVKMDTAGVKWAWQDDTSTEIFAIVEGSAGGTTAFNINAAVDTYTNSAVDVDFTNGGSFDTGAAGTTINIGTTANQIDSGGALSIVSTGADLSLAAGDELNLTDSYRAGSTWSLTDGISLADSSAEWDAFEVAYGEVSLLSAITTAKNAAGTASATKTVGVLTAAVAADTNVSNNAGNLDAALSDYSSVTFLTDVDIYLNGVLLRNGADATANHDVYPGSNPNFGELKFEFPVTNAGDTPDVITMIARGV